MHEADNHDCKKSLAMSWMPLGAIPASTVLGRDIHYDLCLCQPLSTCSWAAFRRARGTVGATITTIRRATINRFTILYDGMGAGMVRVINPSVTHVGL